MISQAVTTFTCTDCEKYGGVADCEPEEAAVKYAQQIPIGASYKVGRIREVRNSLAPLLDLPGALGAVAVLKDLFQALYKVRAILFRPRLVNDVKRLFEPAAKNILDDQ